MRWRRRSGTITYKEMLNKLKARYKPTQNKTLANFEFHKLRQEPMETFDTWVNRVKHEARSCDFKCTSPTCTVQDCAQLDSRGKRMSKADVCITVLLFYKFILQYKGNNK